MVIANVYSKSMGFDKPPPEHSTPSSVKPCAHAVHAPLILATQLSSVHLSSYNQKPGLQRAHVSPKQISQSSRQLVSTQNVSNDMIRGDVHAPHEPSLLQYKQFSSSVQLRQCVCSMLVSNGLAHCLHKLGSTASHSAQPVMSLHDPHYYLLSARI